MNLHVGFLLAKCFLATSRSLNIHSKGLEIYFYIYLEIKLYTCIVIQQMKRVV